MPGAPHLAPFEMWVSGSRTKDLCILWWGWPILPRGEGF